MTKALVNGVETAYEVQGEGTSVLFIHGGFGGAVSTLVPAERRIATILHDGVRLITYDRRCSGQSQYVLDPYTLEDLAADAQALLQHLAIARAIVIGDSMGGMVAQQFALSYPESVTALALVETGVARISDDELFTYFTGSLRNEAAFVGYDFEDAIAEFAMPVCVIHGNADRVVPLDLGHELRDWIPGAEYHEINGATHGILAFPAAAEALRAWVLRMAAAV